MKNLSSVSVNGNSLLSRSGEWNEVDSCSILNGVAHLAASGVLNNKINHEETEGTKNVQIEPSRSSFLIG